MDVLPRMADALVEAYGNFPASQSSSLDALESDVAVSPQVYERLCELVEKSRAMEGRVRVGDRLAAALFRSEERRDDEFIPAFVSASFNREYKFFVNRAHLARTADKIPTDDGLEEHFQAFERSFHSLVCSYFTGKEELDEILRDTNTIAD